MLERELRQQAAGWASGWTGCATPPPPALPASTAARGAGPVAPVDGYVETLKRGYAVVRGDGQVVTSAAAAPAARELEIEFHDGRLPLAPRRKAKDDPPAGQGSLF